MGLSLKPSDAQAGGFLDDCDVVLKECRFVVWDYMGKAERPSVALKVTMEEQDSSALSLSHEQYYSAGDPEKMVVSPDGKKVDVAGAKGLNQQTNAIAFIASIISAGFPEEKITDDVSVFDGLLCHVNQIAQPKRVGLKDQKEGKTYLLVTKILRLPWEAEAQKPARGAPTKKTASPVVQHPSAPAPAAPVVQAVAPTDIPADSGVEDKAKATILQILAEKGGSVAKAKLPTEAFRALSNDSDRNAVVTLVFQEPFLKQAAADGTFSYDGTTVSFVA